MGIPIPEGCSGWCSIGYTLRFPSRPFDSGDWITMACAGLAIAAGIGAELAREYNGAERRALRKPFARPISMDDTTWSHEEARLKAERRATEERAEISDHLPSNLAMITVVSGIIAGLPWLIFALGILLLVLLWRLVQDVRATAFIKERLYLLELARECRQLNIHTPYIMSTAADADIEEAFSMGRAQVQSLIDEMILAQIRLQKKLDDYAAGKQTDQ